MTLSFAGVLCVAVTACLAMMLIGAIVDACRKYIPAAFSRPMELTHRTATGSPGARVAAIAADEESTGSRSENRLPWPSSLETSMVPPNERASRAAMASPRPSPGAPLRLASGER